jgi:hypothetical protein
MYWLISVLAFETMLGWFICTGRFIEGRVKSFLCIFSACLLALTYMSLVVLDWKIWVWGVPFVLYRLANLLRVYRGRLPARQLHKVATRAFGWLLFAHIATTLIAWITVHYHIAGLLVDILLVGQLLCALTLLRASTTTWQYAEATSDSKPLTDNQLPTLSILVPARNETETLELCLQNLTASNYPKLEILVLDDCSANRRTPEVIRSFAHAGVRFVQGQVPDETRWLAKTYAYEQLAAQSSGDILYFCGVDALVEPQTVRELVCLLEERSLDMLSVMPLRAKGTQKGAELLQTMRYYWEMCLPRGVFKRPPVLSTSWLIRRSSLEHLGGFESVSRSISPEASFARRLVAHNTYRFLRSDEALGLYSNKSSADQYSTSVRVRYPQLHRRLELVALASMFEGAFLIGPFVGLLLAGRLTHTLAYVSVWTVSLVCLLITYSIVGSGARLYNSWYGWMLMPVAFVLDLAILHISFWKYEFGTVEWKGRNVCIPVMQIEPPKITRQDSV